jgi:hypothetical protein
MAVGSAEQHDEDSVMLFVALTRETFVRGNQKPSVTLSFAPDRFIGQALFLCSAEVHHSMTRILQVFDAQ